jgi:predicted ATPase/class 3 adenylate cyclase
MTFEEMVDHALAMLQRRGRVGYRMLKRQFQLDDEALEDLKAELIEVQQLAVDQDGTMLVWTGEPGTASPLAPQPTRAPLAYTPPYLAEKILTSKSALEGERKQVTVLFADLKGSMELLADRDPEEARQLLDPVLERMMAAVHRYEGTVNQVMGDGIMALFGAPIAHEDHAVRACYAALAMQASIKEYAEHVQRVQGVPLRIRVGLNAGEVVVRSIGSDLHMDYTAVGQTTHLAARMEQLARPGAILITPEVLRLAEGYVQVKALGPVPIKGWCGPLEVYEVMGAGPVRTRLQAAAARGLTRFVGRHPELATLCQAFEKARRGHGQVAAVIGEAGVGKSRLVWEFPQSLRTHGWLVLESRSLSYGKATPFLPVIELLKAYFQIDGRDDARRIRDKVTAHLQTLDKALAPVLPAFLALLDVPVGDPHWQALDPPQRRQGILNAVKHLLVRESQGQPVLWLFEDLHWIDTETQALLDSVVESLPTARLLLLVNYRPEYQHGWGNKSYYTQLQLDPLPAEHAEELLQALVGDEPGLQPLTRVLIERTGGNPFFLEESVRTLVETQVLVGEQGVYRLAKPLPSIQVPATVQAVLAARIDRLPPEEKQLLQTAAVIGTTIPFALLHAIADPPVDILRLGLAHLQAAEFLYETTLFPDLEYTFKHALTHEVAYNAVLLEQRRVVHERVAQAIETCFHDRLEEWYSALAHHYSRSGNAMKAVEYLSLAGQQAIRRSAYAEAVNHLTAACDLLTTLPETRERHQQELVVQMTLGTALRGVKGSNTPEVEQLYIRARALCEQVGEPPQLFQILWGLWMIYNQRGDAQTMRTMGEQLLSLAQRLDDPDLLLEAHHALWTTLFSGGELFAARTHQDQGLRLYDLQRHCPHIWLYTGHDAGVCCRYRAAPALWLLGYPDQALATSLEALALAQQVDHPGTLTQALYWAAVLHHLRREAPLAKARAEASITVATDQELIEQTAAMPLRGWALAASGHGEEGRAQIQQGLAASRARRAARDRPYHLALLAEASAQVGQPAEGLEAVAEALATVAQSAARWWEAELHRLRGELLLQSPVGRPGAAEACFQQALAVARRQQAKSLELRASMSLSRLWQHQGKRDKARELLAPIYGWFTEGFDTADLQEAKALLTEVSR